MGQADSVDSQDSKTITLPMDSKSKVNHSDGLGMKGDKADQLDALLNQSSNQLLMTGNNKSIIAPLKGSSC